MELSLAADLNNQTYLLTRSAPLHDAMKELSHSITFTFDRVIAFQQLLSLTATMTTEAATLSPSRLAYYFAATEMYWVSLFGHICNLTLSPAVTTNDVALDPSHEEKTVGLQLLKSVLLLWPPSCQWQSSNVLLPRVFTAAVSSRSSSVPRLELQTLQLTVVDVVLAFACAAKRSSCYRKKEEEVEVEVEKVDTTSSNIPGAQSGTTLEILPELRDLLHQTFTKLSWCCTFLLDQSEVYDPLQKKKQNKNISACLSWFEELERCGLRMLQ